jgi:hypothetical protein
MLALLENASEIDKLNRLFTTHDFTALAIEHGFMKRKPRKIDPQHFLVAMVLVILQHASSLRKIALMLSFNEKNPYIKTSDRQKDQ